MRAGIKNTIIAILKDYPNYEAYRRERELDLRYPAIEPDDNVGVDERPGSTMRK